jgi:hypothetical protein
MTQNEEVTKIDLLGNLGLLPDHSVMILQIRLPYLLVEYFILGNFPSLRQCGSCPLACGY